VLESSLPERAPVHFGPAARDDRAHLPALIREAEAAPPGPGSRRHLPRAAEQRSHL